jgi:pimeloyl-ACP methyl ester carboxylesterase
MKSKIITKGDIQIEYYTSGSGPQNIICMHGHGRTVDDFIFLNDTDRKLILIVLPHHGNSKFPIERIEKAPLSTNEFNLLFKQLLDTESITDFHFVAFSQGGRFVLSLIPFHDDKIKSVHLISPDAMDYNSFYNKASRNRWARKLFKSWEDKPQRFIGGARIAHKLGFVRPKVFAFIQKFASNKESFQRASITWRGFRNIIPNNDELKKVIARNDWRFVIIMGKYDQVIRTRQAESFLNKLNQPNSLIEIDCGHDFFRQENIALLSPHIKI